MEMCSGTRRKGNKAFRESCRLGNGRSDVYSQSLLQLLSSLNSFSVFHCSHVDTEAECVDCPCPLQSSVRDLEERSLAIKLWS